MRTATFLRADGTPDLGVCVVLHGQTEFIEKYGEVIDDLRGRGYAVATFDWRGQGGSTRALADPLKCHVGNFREYDEDLATFLEQVIKPMGVAPPLVLAHSMGAHILLRTLHDRPRAFSAAVLSAPMMAVSTRGQPAWVASLATTVMNAAGRSTSWVMGMADRDPLKLRFEDNLVTSDRSRWLAIQALITKKPELRLAGPTWGWLKAANRVDGTGALSRLCRGDRNAGACLRCGKGPDRAYAGVGSLRQAPAARDVRSLRRLRARDPDGKRFDPRPLLESVRRVCGSGGQLIAGERGKENGSDLQR